MSQASLTNSESNTPPYRIAETEYDDDDDGDSSDSYGSSHDYHDDGHDNYDYNRNDNYYDDVESLISEPTKKRVRAIDPNEGRCLVENVEHVGVEYCYCFPIHAPDKEPDLLDSIEWFWNIPYFSLNLQSSRNVFRAGASVKQLYQKHFWLLLPEESIIDRYHDTLTEVNGNWVAHRQSFPNIPDRNDFEYSFIPISDQMRHIALGRQSRHLSSSYTPPLSPSDFHVIVHPFSEMPVMKSHVHPRYVLLEAGRKLTKRVVPEKLTQLLEEYDLLKKVIHIYEAWTAKRPENAMEDTSYYPLENQEDNGEKKDDADVAGEIDEDCASDRDDSEACSNSKDTSMMDANTANADDGMTTDLGHQAQKKLKRKYSLSKSSVATVHDKNKRLETDC